MIDSLLDIASLLCALQQPLTPRGHDISTHIHSSCWRKDLHLYLRSVGGSMKGGSDLGRLLEEVASQYSQVDTLFHTLS